jgi:hypothetical protein
LTTGQGSATAPDLLGRWAFRVLLKPFDAGQLYQAVESAARG